MLHLKPLAAWVLLLPLGIITWALFLESGIHATISGVVLGFLVPVKMSARSEAAHAEHGLAEVLEHRFRPLSTGICVPIFAFFSAGVAVGGFEGLGRALTDSVAVGIMVALVAGKTIGIFGTTWLVTRFKNANLDPDVAWIDVIGLAATGEMCIRDSVRRRQSLEFCASASRSRLRRHTRTPRMRCACRRRSTPN